MFLTRDSRNLCSEDSFVPHDFLLHQINGRAFFVHPLTYPSILTRAGIPPDLKMASSPSLWWDRLCSVPAVQRAVSTSFVFCMVLTMADTIWGERMMAWREASFFESWWTITAALFTTTWRRWTQMLAGKNNNSEPFLTHSLQGQVPGPHRWVVWWVLVWLWLPAQRHLDNWSDWPQHVWAFARALPASGRWWDLLCHTV